MSAVVAFKPPREAVDRAWDRYVALQSMLLDNPRLTTDRIHVEKTLRAHREFSELFAQWDGRQ